MHFEHFVNHIGDNEQLYRIGYNKKPQKASIIFTHFATTQPLRVLQDSEYSVNGECVAWGVPLDGAWRVC